VSQIEDLYFRFITESKDFNLDQCNELLKYLEATTSKTPCPDVISDSRRLKRLYAIDKLKKMIDGKEQSLERQKQIKENMNQQIKKWGSLCNKLEELGYEYEVKYSGTMEIKRDGQLLLKIYGDVVKMNKLIEEFLNQYK
jgi:DNA-binding transcriptional MerR regulator